MYKLSLGNSKIGKTLNFNLPALVTCPKNASCRKFCYANKGTYVFPVVKARYQENLDTYLYAKKHDAIKALRADMVGQIRRHPSYKLVRWHSSGDIPDLTYLYMVYNIAYSTPDKQHLIFTKRYALVNDSMRYGLVPPNLTIVFSSDDYLPLDNPYDLPVARVHDTKTTCGNQTKGLTCEQCKKCWNLKPSQEVIFSKH